MKKLLILASLAVTCLLTSCESTPIAPKPYNEGINITPMPKQLVQQEGTASLSSKFVFVTGEESVKKVASYFASKIKQSTGYDLKIQETQPTSDFIVLTLNRELDVNDEGYLLDVTDKSINIQAKTPQGIFYAMQTFMQLLPAEIESPTLVKGIAWTVPRVTIKDEPRFKYRGQMLDVCRHFTDIDGIKKQLDVLAMFKINKFHWHLTEDQGWRIEIKKYPKLIEESSKRMEGEGNTYGPFFYTQDQVKDVVAYAKERFIEVIPEIELPGHAVAAIHAYPELSCTGKDIDVRNIWGIANDVYCAGNEKTFEFLEDVISEVVPLFESEYFHIGGDECPKIRWESCSKCQARIHELGLKSDKEHSAEERLQSYFVQRIEKILLKYNKKMIGWDEILEGGLAPSATVMSWRGEEGGIAAGNMGHDVIMTPGPWMYVDKYQGDSKLLPVTIGGLLTLEKVYNYEPIPEGLDDSKKNHILGAQINTWTEYKYTSAGAEYDVYPRVIALSELNWTPKEKKNYKDFERRIENQRVRLDFHNINYYIPMPEDKNRPSCNFIAFIDSATLEFKTTEPAKMVYTTDGSEPTLNSSVYTNALTFTENTTIKIRSVLLSGKLSPVRVITLEKQTYAPARTLSSADRTGLQAEYYKGVTRTIAELETQKPIEVEQIASTQESKYRVKNYSEIYSDDFYSTVLTGHINIPADGVYYFSTDTEMWLDGTLLISNEKDNNGTARRFSRSDKSVALAKGYHPVKIARLGAIFGGWPTQWDNITVSIREDKEKEFRVLSAADFK